MNQTYNKEMTSKLVKMHSKESLRRIALCIEDIDSSIVKYNNKGFKSLVAVLTEGYIELGSIALLTTLYMSAGYDIHMNKDGVYIELSISWESLESDKEIIGVGGL